MKRPRDEHGRVVAPLTSPYITILPGSAAFAANPGTAAQSAGIAAAGDRLSWLTPPCFGSGSSLPGRYPDRCQDRATVTANGTVAL